MEVRWKTATPKIGINGFRKPWKFPWHINKLPETDFAPSLMTAMPHINADSSSVEADAQTVKSVKK